MLEKFNDLSLKDKITVICGGIFLLVMLFVLGTGFKGDIPKTEFKVNAEELNKIIDDLGNNYTVTISDTSGDKVSKFIHYYDGKIHLYESEDNDYGYLEYNGKRFRMDGLTRELVEYDESVGYIDNPLYDYDLIKDFTKSCDYEYVNMNSANCKISLNEYLRYHNSKYNTSYVGVDDEFITLSITYGKRLSYLKIDYSSYNKIVNLGENNNFVEFSFKYNVNDFTSIYDNYKDVLVD